MKGSRNRKIDKKTWVETMPYPTGLLKWLFKTPILLYRMGLSNSEGRLSDRCAGC